jgi:hypothetical protein
MSWRKSHEDGCLIGTLEARLIHQPGRFEVWLDRVIGDGNNKPWR